MSTTKNYTSYEMVPWHHKNWFAIASALLFAPVLLAVLLTGDIYYTKKSELKTYSKSARIFLIIWSVLFTLQLVSSVGKELFGSKTSPDTPSNVSSNANPTSAPSGSAANPPTSAPSSAPSSENVNTFLSSMNGRWADANNRVMMLYAHNGKLFGTDQLSNTVMVIQPSGKFDEANNLLPVKLITFFVPPLKTEEDVLIFVAREFGNGEWVDGAPKGGIRNWIKNNLENNSSANVREKLALIKAKLKSGRSLDNLILYNASQNKDGVSPGLKTDDGKIAFELNFVRNLSDVEQKNLEVISANPLTTPERDLLIDKAFALLDDFIEPLPTTQTSSSPTQESSN